MNKHNEFIKCLETLNNMCEILNAHNDEHKYSIVDWVFGFIVFDNDERVCDGNFTAVVKFLADKF